MTPELWQRVKAVLAGALECLPVERQAFLDEACGSDIALRAEVDSLMAQQQSGDSLASGMLPAEFPDAALFSNFPQDSLHTTGEQHSASETDRRFGPYKVIREIGHGGMGAVYLAARADDQYRRQVAIKLIRRGMDTDFVLRRFRNERQILASLNHPNIARLFDGDTTNDGLPYLVMEYVAGLPIDEYCDRHALDTEQRLKLFQQVCAAVHYAHQRQVIHRDIKPNNILVTEDGSLKLLDFGIAKVQSPELAAQTLDPTLPSLRLMTPAYASPEQIKGEPITPASDVYSLGVLLFELLTGHKPYRVKSQAPQEMVRAVLEEEPTKPSMAVTLTEEVRGTGNSSAGLLTPDSVSRVREATPEQLRRRLRGDLDNILLMALRKDPQRRYASVGQFSDDIQRHLEGRPVIARKDTLAYRTIKFVSRSRVGVGPLALSLLLLVPLLLLAYLWVSKQANPAISSGEIQSFAVLPFKTVSGEPDDEYLGTGIADTIASALMNTRVITVRPVSASLKYSGSQNAVEAGRALRVDAILEGTIVRTRDGLRIEAQLVRVKDGSHLWERKVAADVGSLLTVQDVIPIQVARAMGLELSEQESALLSKRPTDSLEAYQFYLKGRYFLARRKPKEATEAIEAFEQAIKLDPNYALAYSGLAHIQMLGINPLVRVERMEKARAAALKALEIDNTLAEARMALGRTLIFFDWDWIASEKTFKQAIALSPNNPDLHYWYSHNLTAQGRHDEALAELRRALEIDPFSSRFATRLGYALYLARRYDEAIEESLKTPFEVDSAYHQVYWRLGLSYAQKGMYSEAFSMLEKALVLSGEMPLEKGSLAYVHAKSGNSAEAYRVLDEISRLPKNEDAPLMMMAGTYACLGDKDKAIERLEKLYEVRDAPLMHIKVDPMLDNIRSDPRYEELLRRIGLTP